MLLKGACCYLARESVLLAGAATRQFRGLPPGISGIYCTADCAERLIFKAIYALGIRFFETGG
jgi:hypothetical protein